MRKDVGAGVEAGNAAGRRELEVLEVEGDTWPVVLCKKCSRGYGEKSIIEAGAYGILRDCDDCGAPYSSVVVSLRSPRGTMVVM